MFSAINRSRNVDLWVLRAHELDVGLGQVLADDKSSGLAVLVVPLEAAEPGVGRWEIGIQVAIICYGVNVCPHLWLLMRAMHASLPKPSGLMAPSGWARPLGPVWAQLLKRLAVDRAFVGGIGATVLAQNQPLMFRGWNLKRANKSELLTLEKKQHYSRDSNND